MRTLRPIDLKEPTQAHRASEGHSWGSKPGLPDLRAHAFPPTSHGEVRNRRRTCGGLELEDKEIKMKMKVRAISWRMLSAHHGK